MPRRLSVTLIYSHSANLICHFGEMKILKRPRGKSFSQAILCLVSL